MPASPDFLLLAQQKLDGILDLSPKAQDLLAYLTENAAEAAAQIRLGQRDPDNAHFHLSVALFREEKVASKVILAVQDEIPADLILRAIALGHEQTSLPSTPLYTKPAP